MTKKTGSKSAPTKKPAKKATANGGKPEVKLDAATTVVLPSPADAPAPPKAAKAKKPAPTVAMRSTPDADMATVPEAASATEATKATDPPPTRPHAPKAKPSSKAETPAAPGSLRAVGAAWIESLRTAGHSVSTVSSYTNDLEVAHGFFGDARAADLTETQIAAFNESKAVLRKKTGKAKAQPTILKTRRALRLALVWAAQTGLIQKAPFAAKTPA
jgi:hypothetical protein